MNKLKVKIFIKVKYNYSTSRGKGIILMDCFGRRKEIYFSSLERTCNRAIMVATINALKTLNRPCEVSLYVQTNIGIRYLSNSKKNNKWVNKDLGEIILATIEKGKHSIEIIDCSHFSEGQLYQESLEGKLYEYFN